MPIMRQVFRNHSTPLIGGHTSEILTLASALDFSRYHPRVYIVSDGDTLSAQKAVDLEHQYADGNTCFDVSS